MLRSEFLWWFLHEERKIPYKNQLQASVYSTRVTRLAVIFRATAPCQHRFSASERRIILNFALQNHLRPVSLPSKIEIVATPSERHLPTAMSYFTQGNWFLNWFWKTMSKMVLDFKWTTSQLPLHFSSTVAVVTTKKLYSCPPAIGFQKLHQPPQCLIWAINHKFALRFSSVRSRATAIFNSNLTTWGENFGVSSTVCCGLMYLGKSCPLIICKGRRTPE